MLPASPELAALLDGGTFAVADCYTLTLAGGSVARWTSAEVPVSYQGVTWACPSMGAPSLQRGKRRLVLGLEVDSLDVEIHADRTAQFNGRPLLEWIQDGGLDGAELALYRAFLPAWGEPVTGMLYWFDGRISDIEVTDIGVKLTVRSWLELLNAKFPRNVYQPSCMYTLFDVGCGVDRAAYAVGGVVGAGSSERDVVTNLVQSAGYFDLGTVTFTSGANDGQRRTVRAYQPGLLTLSLPLPVPPAAGDTFTAWPGCDRQAPTFERKVTVATIPNVPPYQVVINDTRFAEAHGVVMTGLTTNVPLLDYFGNVVYDDYGHVVYNQVTGPSTTLVEVSGVPADGQFSRAATVYTFSAANKGREVSITWLRALADVSCWRIFNNTARFRGTPYVPAPETAR